MKTLVKTALSIGKEKKFFFTESTTRNYITMYDNKPFEKKYESVEEFLKEFHPTVLSENLLNKIKKEFSKENGKVTFKPVGYKANQNFYFKN